MAETRYCMKLKVAMKPDEMGALNRMVELSHRLGPFPYSYIQPAVKPKFPRHPGLEVPGVERVKSYEELAEHIGHVRLAFIYLHKNAGLNARIRFSGQIKSNIIPDIRKFYRDVARKVRELHRKGVI